MTTNSTYKPYPYPANPTRVRVTRGIGRVLGTFLVRDLTCQTTVNGLECVPAREPTIIVFNHTNTFDAPVTLFAIPQRDMTALVKIELFQSIKTAWLVWGWNMIPIQRGEVDRTALRRAMDVLHSKDMLMVSPEGHRNKDGLRNPHSGVVLLAKQGNAVIVPVGVSGTEHFFKNIQRLRRTPVTVNIGRPFRIRPDLNRKQYAHSADEIMYRIAELIQPPLRGAYADLSKATTDTLAFV
jgi:1-acyl-sn-glycerol-3-phosphate acyltransferase